MITDAMDNVKIKQEITDQSESPSKNPTDSTPAINMDISDSGSNFDSDSYVSSDTDLEDDQPSRKKTKTQVVLPLGFLDPLPPEERAWFRKNVTAAAAAVVTDTTLALTPTPTATPVSHENYKQFWKAGDYEGFHADDSAARNVGMDHLRVHPKFLHSNATSHKWALGAMAELLDNALDEICNGASYVNIDMLENKKDKSRMLLVEDNGGGMNPDTMRQCMSLGYSVKSKLANTIGQYGNGFKTSTMRLGADVIVFSRCRGKEGRRPTQSIGMLSYTFLRRTGKEDIVVPMIDYEKRGENWSIMERSSYVDWKRNLETMITWSPYATEEDLLQELELMNDQGTRIVIYNLWEDDEGQLELDFDTDEHDIQIKGANRDVKNIKMAQTYPNSRHFLTYRYSLRSYASILYLRIPDGFRIILRGRNVDHHNLVNDMMLSQKITYKPIGDPQVTTKDPNMVADVTIGFVKDAMCHIDVQGFNVYHKNRLIKPFWRVWNAAGSDGRGVIGVLEANFVEPAHDKQGFERTIVLSRLEQRLVFMQKTFWSTNCHEIGYAKRRHPKQSASPSMESSAPAKASPHPNLSRHDSGNVRSSVKSKRNCDRKLPSENASEAEMGTPGVAPGSGVARAQTSQRLHVESARKIGNGHAHVDSNAELAKLKDENLKLKETLQKMDGLKVEDLLRDLQYERDRNKSVENKYQKARENLEEMDKEHEALINIFDEERGRREKEEESLRMTLKDAYETIEGLAKKVKMLEGKTFSCKTER